MIIPAAPRVSFRRYSFFFAVVPALVRSHLARARAPISRTAAASRLAHSISFTIVAVASRSS